MDADLFLQQFGHLAQGEGGIKKLRDVILQLAVQGRLVKQNASEESAESLLKHMNIQKSKKASENPVPFAIPASWRWVKLNEIAALQIGKTPSRKETAYWSESKYPWVSIADLKHLSTITSTKEGITELAAQDCFNSRISPKGTLVMSFKLTIGKTSFLGMDAYHNEAIISIFPKIDDLKIFMFWALSGLDLTTEQSNAIKGNTLNREKLENLDFPLPPLAEQKRIVTKVDELMALCDKLEAEQKTQRTLKAQAVQSTLHHLTTAEIPASFGTSLNILERTFGTWFDDLATVKHLRATILQLAVQGKLVPQNPTDEPASELLKRIEAEKKRLVKEGKIKRPPTVAPIDDSDEPFILPVGWAWARMGEVYDVRDGTHDSPKYQTEGYPLVTSKDFVNGRISFDKCKLISKEDHEKISYRSKVDNGDILFSMIGGNIGNMVLVDTDREFSIKNVALFKYYSLDVSIPNFLRITLKNLSENVQHQAIGGAQPFVSLGFLRGAQIGLPPLAEQKRIVAKVDELMTLCDQIEAHITHTQTLNTHLMDSLIHRMTEAA